MAALTLRERNQRRFLRNKKDPRHGTQNGYVNLHCRCRRCKDAWADYHLEYMHRTPEQRRKASDRNIEAKGGKRKRPYQERREIWREVA